MATRVRFKFAGGAHGEKMTPRVVIRRERNNVKRRVEVLTEKVKKKDKFKVQSSKFRAKRGPTFGGRRACGRG